MNKTLIVLIIFFIIYGKTLPNDKSLSKNDNIRDSLELPNYHDQNIRQYNEFKLQYNTHFKFVNWLAYLLTLEKKFEQTYNYRLDPKISTGTADDEDFSDGGYERGHLMPAADCTWDEITMSESFFYTNIVPMYPGLSVGKWKQLGDKFRELALEYDSVWVIAGPVFVDEMLPGNKQFERIGPNKICLPRRFYKAGLFKVNGEFKAVGFILPNKQIEVNVPITDFQMTIDELEDEIHMNLFYSIPWRIEEKVESELFEIF